MSANADSSAKAYLATESGLREPAGPAKVLLIVIPFAWSLFQIWYASPLPFALNFGIFNSTEARAIHLCFALFLAYLLFPARRSSPHYRIPLLDWLLACLALGSVAYLIVFYDALAARPGAPILADIVISVAGILLLLEATRRALGPPLMIVAIVFLIYVFGGQYMPDVIAHTGASLRRAMGHMWLTTEGVFGVALGVSTDFVFLFVLFGALLERAGAGVYFIKVAFAMLGRFRGGPAKAAVVASGLSGVISGSSIANVVTTGTFTIPLMKRVGFPPTKAGAVEVAASTNGQLTPPVMGAAAFLMVEYVGIPYLQVIQHAILPALISYIGLLYMVHLEALKLDMQPMRGPARARLLVRLLLISTNLLGILLLSLGIYYGIGWLKGLLGGASVWVIGVLVVAAYIALVALAARQPQLEDDPGHEAELEIPPLGPTVRAGLYFLLPVAVLIWCLMVERFSPGLSAFWAVVFMMIISLTHRPLLALFTRAQPLWAASLQGGREFVDGMVGGARNMIGIGVATATAGIVVGTVTLTGIGLVMTEFVEYISGGNLLLMLFFVALMSLVLGMGLPTTANYIVVSSLMAPVVVELGAQYGLVVPLVAVHMFVFYFGILADDTPPVGLAAFAASAISRADPIRTGVQGFAYDIRTAILPFMFIFNNQLLLIGLTGVFDLLVTILSATVAMMLFAAATQRFWFTHLRWIEVAALLLIAFTLFRPGFWWDQIYPPYETRGPDTFMAAVASTEPGGRIVFEASGLTIEGDEVSKTAMLELPAGESPRARLRAVGLSVMTLGERVQIQNVRYGTPAQKAGLETGFTIDAVQHPVARPPKELAMLPALALLAVVAGVQLRRRRARAGTAFTAAA